MASGRRRASRVGSVLSRGFCRLSRARARFGVLYSDTLSARDVAVPYGLISGSKLRQRLNVYDLPKTRRFFEITFAFTCIHRVCSVETSRCKSHALPRPRSTFLCVLIVTYTSKPSNRSRFQLWPFSVVRFRLAFSTSSTIGVSSTIGTAYTICIPPYIVYPPGLYRIRYYSPYIVYDMYPPPSLNRIRYAHRLQSPHRLR